MLHLPHDLALQRSLKLTLRNSDDQHQVEDHDGEGDEYEEQHFPQADVNQGGRGLVREGIKNSSE